MACQRVDPAYTVVSAESQILQKMELLVGGASDLASAPMPPATA